MSKLDSERKNSAAPSGTPVEKDSGRKGIDEPSDFSDAPVQLPANGTDGFSEEFPLLSHSVEKEDKKSAGNNSVSSAPHTPESSKGGKTTYKTQSKKAPGTTGARLKKTATPRSSGSPNLTKKKLAPARRRNTSEKIVFILCMVLLAPLVLTLFTAVFLIFVFSFFLTFAVAGGLVLALVLLVRDRCFICTSLQRRHRAYSLCNEKDLLLFQVRISQIESPDASALRILHADLISRSITGKELLLGKSHG